MSIPDSLLEGGSNASSDYELSLASSLPLVSLSGEEMDPVSGPVCRAKNSIASVLNMDKIWVTAEMATSYRGGIALEELVDVIAISEDASSSRKSMCKSLPFNSKWKFKTVVC